MKGNRPSSGAPIALEDRRAGRRRRRAADEQQRPARRAGARSCAGRGGSATARAARWRTSRGRSSIVLRRLDHREERAPRIVLPVRRRSASGVDCASSAPSRISSSSSHSARLVHDVAGDEQRRPVVRELVEHPPQLRAQDRIEPDSGLVEHEQLGLAEQRARERHARPLPARQRADVSALREPGEADRLDAPRDAAGRLRRRCARSSGGSRAR